MQEVIQDEKALSANDICYEADSNVEELSQVLEQETSCKDEIENEENIQKIKFVQDNISEDVLYKQSGHMEYLNMTNDDVEINVPEVASVAREVEAITDNKKVEDVEVNGCSTEINQEPARLDIGTIRETVIIEYIEIIGSIQRKY